MLLIIFLTFSAQACPDFLTASSMLSYLQDHPDSLNSCALQALSNNKLEILLAQIESSIFSDVSYSSELKSELDSKKKQIDKLIQKASAWGKSTTIPAAFQWAQSPNTTYLDIKFSHRIDAPGCSSVDNLKVNIEAFSFYFSGSCLRSNQKVRFLIEFETWAEVDVKKSSFHPGNSGRVSVELVKKKVQAWDLPMKGKKPQNLQIWWEIKEKFKKEMNRLTGEVDEDDKGEDQFDELLNNPNVVIENSIVNGKYVDNRKERGYV